MLNAQPVPPPEWNWKTAVDAPSVSEGMGNIQLPPNLFLLDGDLIAEGGRDIVRKVGRDLIAGGHDILQHFPRLHPDRTHKSKTEMDASNIYHRNTDALRELLYVTEWAHNPATHATQIGEEHMEAQMTKEFTVTVSHQANHPDRDPVTIRPDEVNISGTGGLIPSLPQGSPRPEMRVHSAVEHKNYGKYWKMRKEIHRWAAHDQDSANVARDVMAFLRQDPSKQAKARVGSRADPIKAGARGERSSARIRAFTSSSPGDINSGCRRNARDRESLPSFGHFDPSSWLKKVFQQPGGYCLYLRINRMALHDGLIMYLVHFPGVQISSGDSAFDVFDKGLGNYFYVAVVRDRSLWELAALKWFDMARWEIMHDLVSSAAIGDMDIVIEDEAEE
ncbi:BUD3-like protein [Colletotrichum sp. SAR 10_65]|nr:BUD3-like protein [Colletotrichum sp. SAR 10_65]